MKVVFRDKHNNIRLIEATEIVLNNDEDRIEMTMTGYKVPFICKNKDLVHQFEYIIKSELNTAYIDFSNYIFDIMSAEDIAKAIKSASGEIDKLQDKLDNILDDEFKPETWEDWWDKIVKEHDDLK